jgi:hypothetical protein
MALIMVLLVLTLTLAFFYLKCTMMQSLITLWSSVMATILTFSFYENVAALFISRGYGLQWAIFGSYVIVFIAGFAVLRSACEYLIAVNIDLGGTVKASAAVIFGLITGIVFSGNLLVAMGLLPLQGKVFYSRFDPSEPVALTRPRVPALSTDGFVAGLYGLISSGSMSSGKSFKVLHADYLTRIHLNKLKVQDNILSVCSPKAIEIPSKKGQQPVRLWTSPDKRELVVVRMGILTKKIAEGGANSADGKVEFFPAQIRLIAKDKAADSAGNPLAGSGKAFYPAGFIRDGLLVKAELNETISLDPKESENRILWLDVAFDMPQGYSPVLLDFKLNAVADLTSYHVVKSTPEVENALKGKGVEEENEGSQVP